MRKIVLALMLVCLMSTFALAVHVDPALVDSMKGNERIPVVVMMNPGAKHVDTTQLGGKLGHTYSIINGFSAELPVAAIKALENNPNVFSIALDKEVTIDLTTAVQATNVDDVWNSYGAYGSGVKIAIVDTGICQHADFQNRIVGWKDYVNGRNYAYDDHYHGTHCAGIAAGNGSTYDGPAKSAYLMGVKVLNSYGSGSWSNIIAGVDWAVNNGADVISMSLGGSVSQSSTTDPMCAAVRNAWNAGVVVVVAAGNSGSGFYTIASPGNEPAVITVGASDDRGTSSISDDIVASFSSRGPTPIDYWVKPDVVAPGVNITAADGRDCSGYYTISGTSMATPLVAGVCAQILGSYPSKTPSQIKTALMNTARDIMNNVNERYIQGTGLIDAYAAYRY